MAADRVAAVPTRLGNSFDDANRVWAQASRVLNAQNNQRETGVDKAQKTAEQGVEDAAGAQDLANQAASSAERAQISADQGILAAAAAQEAANTAQPIPGEIRLWPNSTPPEGWLLCDGATITPTQYPELHSVVGGTLPTFSAPVSAPEGLSLDTLQITNLQAIIKT